MTLFHDADIEARHRWGRLQSSAIDDESDGGGSFSSGHVAVPLNRPMESSQAPRDKQSGSRSKVDGSKILFGMEDGSK